LIFPPFSPIHFHSFAWAALTRIHHLAFSSVLFSVFPLCLGLNPCSPASVYLINYFKDFRPFLLSLSNLINLSKVQMKIAFTVPFRLCLLNILFYSK